MKPAIEVQNISKVYQISHEENVDRTSMKETIVRTMKKPIELFTGHNLPKEEFWALQDVSFDVKQGDIVGIIGRNGSGKSTLLKILSKITEPTTGQAIMRGKSASLLEVGTGFHPELTGRENIFFNGSILGMSKKEITSKFDEIVKFSEVEKFLDTPVKFYSSGMYVRLAFSVAAHLEPDILIVDEVLAVGDAQFQKKCLGKMGSVAESGRTVLFVSHNMSAVTSLCNKGVYMEGGSTEGVVGIEQAIDRYLKSTGEPAKGTAQKVYDKGQPLRALAVKQKVHSLQITAEFECAKALSMPILGIVISDSSGRPLFGANPRVMPPEKVERGLRKGTIKATVTEPRLQDGDYILSVWLGDEHNDFFADENALSFSIRGMSKNLKLQDPSFVGPIEPSINFIIEGI